METKNYLIKVYGLGYTGQYTLPLTGVVDADRIDAEATHLILTKKLILTTTTFYVTTKTRFTYKNTK
mgnify:CR=1 FL=1